MSKNRVSTILVSSLVITLFIVGVSFLNDQNKDEVKINKAVDNKIDESIKRKLGKAIFYLENSGSMFGYVNGGTDFVNVITELSEKPRFVEEMTPREFFFVNGGNPLSINMIGTRPSTLKENLTREGFSRGDVSRSNLTGMFQTALSKAVNDTISILISDGIYDIGNNKDPLTALAIEGRATRSRFIERLTQGDFQTIIIKLGSRFFGDYFPVTGGVLSLTQERPYYVWIFGDSEFLNNYFSEEYIKSLVGYQESARFLKLSQKKIPHRIVTHEKKGDFAFDKKNKNKLIDVKPDRKGNGFQFTIAVDYSGLPFSDSYLSSTKNYMCSNTNYIINEVSGIGNVKLFGLSFKPTHLITVYTEKSPYGQMDVSLRNNIPKWIENTNIDTENKIIGDTNHTFGFKFLTDAISEAYQYKSQEANIITFSFELLK